MDVTKKYIIAVLAVVLSLITFFTLPSVDYTRPDVLFYFEHLPAVYYLSVFASIVAAIFFGRSRWGIFFVVLTSLLLLWTPSVMLFHPWLLDSYPFVAEAVYVARNGGLGPFHVNLLQETPVLGLVFGSYLLITNMSPFELLKIYPCLVATIFAILLYVMARKANLDQKISVLAPLLFVSVLWPNLLHLCRQGYSLVYYLAAWFLVLRLVFGKPDRRIFVLLVFQVFVLTLSHPASAFFFFINMVAVATLGYISRRIPKKNLRLISHTAIISALTWLLWNVNCIPYSKAPSVWAEIGHRFVQSFLEGPAEVPGVAKIFVGYTHNYSLIINVRLALTLLIFAGIVLFPFALYRYIQDKKLLVILVAWGLSNLSSAIPLLYAGLPFFARPALFTFISWAPLGALIYKTLDQKRKTKMKILFIAVFVVLPSFLMPVVKYAPLPFNFPTSRELANKVFLDLHWQGGKLVYLERNVPYYYSYILYGVQDAPRATIFDNIYFSGLGLNPNVTKQLSFWVTERLVSRDAFWNFTPSMLQVVENLTIDGAMMHNKVYDSGWPESILIPASNSTK